MKLIYAGPSLYRSQKPIDSSISVFGPVAQGEIAAAVHGGANVIGLIDGVYESVAAIWHKEILFALSSGVQVFGGASLGALRAAERAAFGMIGVGEIYGDYQSGKLVDDADVALLHAPKELGYRPVTEAMVDVRATIKAHVGCRSLACDDGDRMIHVAEQLFFKDRTWRAIIAGAAFLSGRDKEIHSMLTSQPISQKRLDAEMVIDHVAASDNSRGVQPADWTFSETSFFEPWQRPDNAVG